ncbi:MAG: peptidoglycan D,D-transpeptidase FtsI family protein [Anaerocolumna sp.]
MFDVIWEKIKEIVSSRLFPVSLVFLTLIAILISRLFVLQIVEGDEHSGIESVKRTDEREIKSTRGNIYDRNGILLAYNEISYSVVMEQNTGLSTNKEINDMLFRLINILEEYDNVIENDFGIVINKEGKLEFNVSGNAELRFKKNAYGLGNVNQLTEEQKNATAEEVFNFLRFGDKKYIMFNISDEYSLEEALKIMTLRYALFTSYPGYIQVIVSSNVSNETAHAIYENSSELPGVEISQQSYRKYNDSIYNAHILGYTGLVTEDELENMPADTTYNTTDMIGKLGIEKVYEEYLSGTKGFETVSVSASRKYLETLEKTEPIAGEDIYLTIDSELNKAYYKLIERNLAGVLLTKIVNSTDAGTRGISAKDIKIPIYDVYFALINNNVVDITELNDEDATDLEQEVYEKYITRRDDILSNLDDLLQVTDTTLKSSLPEQTGDFLDYIYTALKESGVLLTSSIDTTDITYQNYLNDKISLSQFLMEAIAKNWVDISKLDIGDSFYITEELFDKLVEYTWDYLKEDKGFLKKIYKDLVYSYKLSGTEICLLLFDQDVLKYNAEDIMKLENGTMSSYTFITEKIRKIEITPAQLALDPCSASIVVTDVNSGDVIAMVTYPSYDTNLYANKIDYDYYMKVTTDLSEPTIARASKQRTAPGSTFKMLTAIASLEEGVLMPTETVYDKTIFTKLTDSTTNAPRDWTNHSHGNVDVTHALEVSCNYFFYEMGYRLGQDSTGYYRSKTGTDILEKYAKIMRLDQKSGVEVEELSPQISTQDSVRSAIGQGTNNFAPIQLARYLTTVASSGISYDLTLLDKIVGKDGEIVLDNSANQTVLTDFKASSWELVQEGMYKVGNGSESSVSYIFKDFPYTVAGKTGTAQESKSRGNHALFVSYAPYDKPEIAVTVVIPNGYASSNAVELSKDVYGYYFDVEGYKDLVEGPAIMPESSSITFTD